MTPLTRQQCFTSSFHPSASKRNRLRRIEWSRPLYRNRNAIERMFGRIEGFRHNATRYDRRADIFPSAVAPAAIVSYRL